MRTSSSSRPHIEIDIEVKPECEVRLCRVGDDTRSVTSLFFSHGILPGQITEEGWLTIKKVKGYEELEDLGLPLKGVALNWHRVWYDQKVDIYTRPTPQPKWYLIDSDEEWDEFARMAARPK